MLSVRTNPSTLAAGLGAVKNALRKLTDLRVNLAHPMYTESQICTTLGNINVLYYFILDTQCTHHINNALIVLGSSEHCLSHDHGSVQIT